MLCYAMLCYAMLCYAMLCYAMLCYAMLCTAMLCYDMICYAVLYYDMICYAFLCATTPCHVMLWLAGCLCVFLSDHLSVSSATLDVIALHLTYPTLINISPYPFSSSDPKYKEDKPFGNSNSFFNLYLNTPSNPRFSCCYCS